MPNPWNTTATLYFDDYHKQKLLEYYNTIISNHMHKRKKAIKDTTQPRKSVDYLESLYKEGYGFKILSRCLGISDVRLKSLFDYLGLERRRGTNVVTDKLRLFRSSRVAGNKNPLYDWCNTKPEMHKKTSRGVQGYYRKPDMSFVWLRSTWEYIYASWLDSKNIRWSYEGTQYVLPNGENYRPDFNILDVNDKIIGIVEIKGYFKNRIYKIDLFKQAFPQIPIIVVDDVTKYCKSSYSKEIKEWKKIIKLNQQQKDVELNQ